MKKIITVLLAVMLIASLASCGSSDATESEKRSALLIPTTADPEAILPICRAVDPAARAARRWFTPERPR